MLCFVSRTPEHLHAPLPDKMVQFDDDTLRKAVEMWHKDEEEAKRRYGHISNWNTSNVTNMCRLFQGAKCFNEPLDSWNTLKVTTMRDMFHGAQHFDQPLASWNTSQVTGWGRCFFTPHASTSRWRRGTPRR